MRRQEQNDLLTLSRAFSATTSNAYVARAATRSALTATHSGSFSWSWLSDAEDPHRPDAE